MREHHQRAVLETCDISDETFDYGNGLDHSGQWPPRYEDNLCIKLTCSLFLKFGNIGVTKIGEKICLKLFCVHCLQWCGWKLCYSYCPPYCASKHIRSKLPPFSTQKDCGQVKISQLGTWYFFAGQLISLSYVCRHLIFISWASFISQLCRHLIFLS